jgi:hypothetical protein
MTPAEPRPGQDTGMTPLTAAILAILESEWAYPPKSIAKVIECLRYTGFGLGATTADVEIALADMYRDGRIERLWRKGVAHYRISHNVEVGRVKAC